MAIVETFKNLFNDFVKAFDSTIDKTFVADGYDNYNGWYYTQDGGYIYFSYPREKQFKYNSLTKASTIFGLSNRDLSKNITTDDYKTKEEVPQSFKNIAKNFIGWQEDASIFRLIINFLIITPLNIILTPLRFLHNLLKIVTEVIPGTIAEFTQTQFKKVAANAINDYTNKNYGSFALSASATFLLLILSSLSKYIYWVGCALTSPIDTIISVWHTSYKHPNSPFKNNKIYAYIFAGLTALGIGIIYTIAFPLAIKALTLSIAPVISHHLPSLMNAIDKITNAMPQVFTSIGNFMLNHVGFIAMPAKLLQVYSVLTTMPAVVTLGTFIGLGLAIIGPPANLVLDKIKRLWHTSSERTVEVENSQPASHQDTTPVTNSYSRIVSTAPAPGHTSGLTTDNPHFHPYGTTGKYSPPTFLDSPIDEPERTEYQKIGHAPTTPPVQNTSGDGDTVEASSSYDHALYEGGSDQHDENPRRPAFNNKK